MSNDSKSFIDLDVEDMKLGLTFDNEDVVILSINKWSEKTLCPLSRARYQNLARHVRLIVKRTNKPGLS